MKLRLVFLVLCFSCQEHVDYSGLKKVLTKAYIDDQAARIDYANLRWSEQNRLDRDNLEIVTKIIDSLGWLGISQIGDTASSALFLVIQHANVKAMEKYLPALKKAASAGEASKGHLALMIDRIEVYNKRPQIYGTQTEDSNGVWVISKMLDPVNINERRKTMGLGSIESYLNEIRERY